MQCQLVGIGQRVRDREGKLQNTLWGCKLRPSKIIEEINTNLARKPSISVMPLTCGTGTAGIGAVTGALLASEAAAADWAVGFAADASGPAVSFPGLSLSRSPGGLPPPRPLPPRPVPPPRPLPPPCPRPPPRAAAPDEAAGVPIGVPRGAGRPMGVGGALPPPPPGVATGLGGIAGCTSRFCRLGRGAGYQPLQILRLSWGFHGCGRTDRQHYDQ